MPHTERGNVRAVLMPDAHTLTHRQDTGGPWVCLAHFHWEAKVAVTEGEQLKAQNS